eukprot:TRINITY_DN923_c0_g1_i1.p1 TRINITY_DN923_c0_g1~~TRINITY_DN923_c0_g1_i1.p1  ORF type:complete len:514 (+),score=149.83 TRINITY_DN923_c0_g1_i1:220-1542(+)
MDTYQGTSSALLKRRMQIIERQLYGHTITRETDTDTDTETQTETETDSPMTANASASACACAAATETETESESDAMPPPSPSPSPSASASLSHLDQVTLEQIDNELTEGQQHTLPSSSQQQQNPLEIIERLKSANQHLVERALKSKIASTTPSSSSTGEEDAAADAADADADPEQEEELLRKQLKEIEADEKLVTDAFSKTRHSIPLPAAAASAAGVHKSPIHFDMSKDIDWHVTDEFFDRLELPVTPSKPLNVDDQIKKPMALPTHVIYDEQRFGKHGIVEHQGMHFVPSGLENGSLIQSSHDELDRNDLFAVHDPIVVEALDDDRERRRDLEMKECTTTTTTTTTVLKYDETPKQAIRQSWNRKSDQWHNSLNQQWTLLRERPELLTEWTQQIVSATNSARARLTKKTAKDTDTDTENDRDSEGEKRDEKDDDDEEQG